MADDITDIEETCGCGATYSVSSSRQTQAIDSAANWRETHRHTEPVELSAVLMGEAPLSPDNAAERVGRAIRIAQDPDAASDSDKLASLADWFDSYDAKMLDVSGSTEVQDFLRDLSKRLEG